MIIREDIFERTLRNRKITASFGACSWEAFAWLKKHPMEINERGQVLFSFPRNNNEPSSAVLVARAQHVQMRIDSALLFSEFSGTTRLRTVRAWIPKRPGNGSVTVTTRNGENYFIIYVTSAACG